MANRTIRKEVRSKTELTVAQQMEFAMPPAEEKPDYVHCKVPSSLKWKVRLHLMKLESEGNKMTMTAWVTSLIEAELRREGR